MKMIAIRPICLVLLFSSAIRFTDAGMHGQNDRVKRQTSNDDYDLRDCESQPNYLPETVVPTINRLQKLREEMRLQDIDAYVIPAEDAHQSKYVADRDKRREFMSGFSGHTGLAIVTRNKDYQSRNKAAVWVEARYFIQAKMEMDCNWLSMEIGEENVLQPDDWLTGDTYELSDERHAQLPDGARIGFDPTLLSLITYFEWNETFIDSPRNIELVQFERNLVDIVWEELVGGKENLPKYPGEKLIVMDETYSGRTWQEKIFYDNPENDFEYTIMDKMDEKKAKVLVIHKLDEVAWLFNLRGDDILHNPVFIAFCIITKNDLRLYMYDGTKRTDPVRYKDVYEHLGLGCENTGPTCIKLRGYDDFFDDLRSLGQTSQKIWHSDEASFAIYDRVRKENRIEKPSPLLLMKAQKNDEEILGMKSANLKDSVALCNLFGWLQEKIDGMESSIRDRGRLSYLSEKSIKEEADNIRDSLWNEVYFGESFTTVSAFGSHGGLLNYEVTEETNFPVHYEGMFRFDSGAQYKEGTTDIARTFYFGNPTKKMKDAYTRALMGHIDLVTSKFRTEVYGRELDGIAREPLWSNGFDYKHVTGHGVGHFLNVEEGPAVIGPNYSAYHQPIAVGMFFTDEPGYYEAGDFGLKIENVMYVKRANPEYSFDTFTYLEFEVVSLIPFEPRLIDFSLLTRRQIAFYNYYMDRIRKEVGSNSRLDSRGREWMEWKTASIHTEYKYKYNTAGALHSNLVLMVILVAFAIIKF